MQDTNSVDENQRLKRTFVAFGRHGEPCRRAGRHPQGRSAVLRVSAAHQALRRMRASVFSSLSPLQSHCVRRKNRANGYPQVMCPTHVLRAEGVEAVRRTAALLRGSAYQRAAHHTTKRVLQRTWAVGV
ncbi:hypothetical protein HC928_11110 [bacterium]|nr:hypothetical protein [bacterium]